MTEAWPSSERRAARILAALVLAAGTWLAFGSVRANDFVAYDDNTYITSNPKVLDGITWDGVRWAATTAAASNWHPMTWLSHMLDVEVFGPDPGAHHLVSLALHLATGLVLLAFLLRTTGALVPAFVASALFLWHPLRVESVAWAAERKDVLSGLFFALTLLAYAGWARSPTLGRYLLSLFVFALGLLAKPMLVSVPIVLLLVDFWPLGRIREGRGLRVRLVEKVPFALLALASSAVTIVVQRAGGAVVRASEVPPSLRVGNALRSLGVYILQFFWPTKLACFYPHPLVTGAAVWGPATAVLGGFAIATLVAVRLRRRAPFLLAGLGWMLVMSLPVLGLLQVGRQAHADRYTYLPGIGLALALSYGAWAAAKARPRTAPALSLCAAVFLGALVAGSARQVRVWKSSESLFAHAIEVTEGNHLAEGNLGYVLLERGELEAAREHLERSLAILPGDANVLLNLSTVDLRLGRLEEARRNLERLAAATPGDWRVHSGLAELAFRSGDPETAAARYRDALRLGSSSSQDLVNLGMAELALGHREEARLAFERAAPTNLDGIFGLGVLAQAEGDLPAAVANFRRCVEQRPDFTDAWLGLGDALAALGERGLALDARARAAALASDWDRAIRLEEAALELLPPDHEGEARARLAAWREAARPGG